LWQFAQPERKLNQIPLTKLSQQNWLLVDVVYSNFSPTTTKQKTGNSYLLFARTSNSAQSG
jgi:hypothetical protein